MSDKTNPDRSTDPSAGISTSISTGLTAGRTLPSLALTRAGSNTKPAPASVYLLADHLDTVLAAAEDIVNARLTWNSARRADQREISQEKHSFRDDIEDIRKLENTIIIRVLTSRERAEDVARDDKRFRQLAKLYVAGTAVLLDAVQECGDSTDSDFATADTIPAYLRSRGLVDPDAPAPDIGENLQVGEDFLIARRIAAGPLMDLAAALLDALELHYDLFLDEDELAMAPQINRFEDDPVSAEQDTSAAHTGDAQMHVASAPKSALEAAIEDVREDASQQQTDTAKQSNAQQTDIWNKMSTAGSVIAPVISPPEPEPLVVVSKIEAIDDKIEETAARDDSDTLDHVADKDGEGEAVTADAATEVDHEDQIAVADDEISDTELVAAPEKADADAGDSTDDEAGSIDATSLDEQSDDATINATTGDETSLDTDPTDAPATEGESEDNSANDTTDDDTVVITAANDDDTSASNDSQDAADLSDSDEDEIALIADNMDADPDTVLADSAETETQNDAQQSDTDAPSDADAGPDEHDVEAVAKNSADDDTPGKDKDKRTSSKSLVSRLSVIKP